MKYFALRLFWRTRRYFSKRARFERFDWAHWGVAHAWGQPWRHPLAQPDCKDCGGRGLLSEEYRVSNEGQPLVRGSRLICCISCHKPTEN